MGQYLHIGLCYKVRVRRKLLSDQKITEAELLQGMTRLLDFTLSERLDAENELIFVLYSTGKGLIKWSKNLVYPGFCSYFYTLCYLMLTS